MTVDPLAGCRVLVVEDEALVAMMIEDVLQDLGCIIIGPASRLETAFRLANDEAPDIALLDVSVTGGKIFPVADMLLERGVPFALASGYGNWALPENLRNQPRLTKPFTPAQLKEQIRHLCSQCN